MSVTTRQERINRGVNPLQLRDVAAAPAATGTQLILFTDDVAGEQEVFYDNPTRGPVQFTSAGLLNSAIIGGFTAGSVIFANGSGIIAQDNANLFWDDANNRLGIGTATPSSKLSVIGDATFKGTTHEVVIFEGSLEDIVIRAGKSGGVVTINDNHNGKVILANGGGNVGIGKTSPVVALDVVGDIILTGALTIPGTTTLNTVAYTWPGADGGAADVLTTNGAGALSWETPAAGVTLFTGLTDTPNSYTANRLLKANAGATAVEHSTLLFDNGSFFGVGVVAADGSELSLYANDANSATQIRVRNATANTAALAGYNFAADGALGGNLFITSSNFTPASGRLASSVILEASSGGAILQLLTLGAAGIRLGTGGVNKLQLLGTAVSQLELSSVVSTQLPVYLVKNNSSLNGQFGIAGSAFSGSGIANNDVVLFASAGVASIYIGSASNIPVRFVSTSLERARILGNANTFQFFEGGTVQGGSGVHTLTLSGGAGAASSIAIGIASEKIAAFGATPVVQPTGVAVTAAAIHAALVSLGWITA